MCGALLHGRESRVAPKRPDDIARATLAVDDGDAAEARRFNRRDPEVLQGFRELVGIDAESSGVDQDGRTPVEGGEVLAPDVGVEGAGEARCELLQLVEAGPSGGARMDGAGQRELHSFEPALDHPAERLDHDVLAFVVAASEEAPDRKDRPALVPGQAARRRRARRRGE